MAPVSLAPVQPARLTQALAGIPRVRLATLPTPLEAAPRLSAQLGGTEVWVKRDDLTGLALGGNKTRQLEFLLGDALARGATAVLTGAGVQSNYCRQLAAACARLGLRACFVLRGEPAAHPKGNLLLDALLGAECRFLPPDRFYEDFPGAAEAWANELRGSGERPYLADVLGWDSLALSLGALGYVEAALELERQFEACGWWPDALYVCSGAATQAGLTVARLLLDLPYRVIGISASPFVADKPTVIAAVAGRAAQALGFNLDVRPADVTNLDGYLGDGYGAPTPLSLEALRLAARLEGLLLDPTYTAKAFGGLLDHVRRGVVRRGERVLFLHTGGAPALFLDHPQSLVDTQP